MEIIKIYNKARRPFELTPIQLRAVLTKKWEMRRTIARGTVRKIFRHLGDITVRTFEGELTGSLRSVDFRACAGPDYLEIGCQTFKGKNFQAIKKWALRK